MLGLRGPYPADQTIGDNKIRDEACMDSLGTLICGETRRGDRSMGECLVDQACVAGQGSVVADTPELFESRGLPST